LRPAQPYPDSAPTRKPAPYRGSSRKISTHERVVRELYVAREASDRPAGDALDRGAERRRDRLLVLAAQVLDGPDLAVREQELLVGHQTISPEHVVRGVVAGRV
jgi:hypothetical protein